MAIIALIFFCFLFFHQEKKRKSGRGGKAPAKALTNLLRLPYAPHEGPNNPLRLFGKLDGDHRLDLLLLPFLSSREEKEVGVRGRSPRESSRSVVGVIPWVGAYRIRPPEALLRGQMIHKMSVHHLSDLLHECTQYPICLPDEPDEGPNNPLRLFGKLDGDHRLDLLLLPFLLSREEKEVGARGRSPRESPNEPPIPTIRTP